MSGELTLAQRIKVRAATGIPMMMDPETMRALAKMIDLQDDAMEAVAMAMESVARDQEHVEALLERTKANLRTSLIYLICGAAFAVTGLVFWWLA